MSLEQQPQQQDKAEEISKKINEMLRVVMDHIKKIEPILQELPSKLRLFFTNKNPANKEEKPPSPKP